MDVSLPDGSIIKDVPDGMSKADLTAKLASNGYDVSKLQPQTPASSNQLMDFASALNQHIMNPLHGAAQLIEHGINAGANQLDVNNPVRKYVNSVVSQDDAAMAAREKSYQENTPNTPGAYVGAGIGEVAPYLVGAVPKALTSVGEYTASKIAGSNALADALRKITSGATQGAAIGAVQPVTDNNYADTKTRQIEAGGVLGGAVPLVANVLGAPAKAIGNLINPQKVIAPKIAEITGVPQQQLIDALKNPKEYIKGSTPTSAQVLSDTLGSDNVPVVQLEKAMSNLNPEFKGNLAQTQINNNSARLDAIKQMAGTPEDMTKAISARRDFAKQYWNDAGKNPVPLSDIANTVDKLAGSSFGTDPVIARSLVKIKNDIISRADQNGMIDPSLMDGIRQNMNNIIKDNSSNGVISSKQEAGLIPLVRQITDSIESTNPGYSNYLASYAKLSEPINTMETGSEIANRLNGASNSAGDATVTLNAINQAIKKTDNSNFGISKEGRDLLENLRLDLQRESVSNSIKTPGSDTIANAQANDWLTRAIMGQSPIAKNIGNAIGAGVGFVQGGPLAGVGGWVGSNKLQGMAANRLNKAYADALANPDVLAKNLEKYGSANKSELANQLKKIPLLNTIR